MKREEIKRQIDKAYLIMGYVFFGLIIMAFIFAYEVIFTGDVSLSIDSAGKQGSLSIALLIFLLVCVIYGIYYFFFVVRRQKSRK